MNDVRGNKHGFLFAHWIPADLDIGQRCSGCGKRWWIEAQRLLEHLQGVGQLCQVGIGGGATLEDTVNLQLYFFIGIGMRDEEIPGPGQRCSSSFMACTEERQRFVKHLLVTHPAILVPGSQEEGEAILLFKSTGTPFVDHLLNSLPERCKGLPGSDVSWKRQAEREGEGHGGCIIDVCQCCLHGRT